MLWFHRLRQRLSLTRNEAITIIFLSTFFAAGLVVRHFQLNATPVAPDAYDEMDRMFLEGSAAVAMEADVPNDPEDTTGAGPALGREPQAGPNEKKYLVDAQVASAVGKVEASDFNARIDLNRASTAELERLPRVGPKTALRIVEFRQTYGPLRQVDDLTQIRGIGPKTLELIRPFAMVTTDSAAEAQD